MTKKTRGILAAGHPDTASAGLQMLELGGNAYDAALAAMLTSFVSEASLTSMGGGGFMNVYTANGWSCLFDFFVQTPIVRRSMNEVDFRESFINFGTKQQRQFSGKASVAVPGCPAGLFHIHQRLGSLPMKEIIQPAVKLAREGVVITPYQAYSLFILEPILMEKPETAAVYGRDGETFKTGERMRMWAYADTLELLAKEGVRAFYEGEIGTTWTKDNALHGGSVSREDLLAYQVVERTPLTFSYHDHLLLTNPAPSAGGSLIVHGLEQLGLATPKVTATQGRAYVERMMAVMQQMEAYRKLRIKDLSPGNTTHLSVLDEHGNAASLTTTVGGASGELIPYTGIQTNNMLGELDLFPGGVYQWPTNQRVSSMMSPTIVLHKGQPNIVLGSGGSSRIRTAILQVVSFLIDHHLDLQEAVNHPRLHWEAGQLNLEPGLVSSETALSVSSENIMHWQEANMYFGGVHTVVRKADGRLLGGADARRAGVVRTNVV
ncbi:MAG: gamma-glutamyltransferase [Bacteroidota bacterium]